LINQIRWKSSYFNAQNIDTLTDSWIQEFQIHRGKVCFIPSNAAFLILDMQNIFLDEGSHAFIPSAPTIVPRIRSCASLFRQYGLPVFLTRHINTHTDAGLMATWWTHLISDGERNSHIIRELSVINAPVLIKSQYDAFHETPLENLLKQEGVTQIVITGVMSHLCCETTARSAFMRNFTVFFPVDGTATYNMDFHRATLLNLSHGFAVITRMKDIVKEIEYYFHEE
jgi:bifunctional isochorismate lyase/aryl carrier protein